MKKIRYILMPFLSLVFFASCQDAIDIKQPGQLYAEDTFETVEDLQKGIYGCYGPFASSGGIDTEVQFASIFTDECSIGPSNIGQGLTGDATYLYTLNVNSSAPNNLWQSNYTLINFANRVLTAAENITPTTAADQAAYDNVIAQARIFRAWGHFKLLSYFSTNMDKDHDAELGVIKMDFVPKITDVLERSTVGEIYNFIKADLDSADGLLNGDLLLNPNPRVFLSKDFVTAFRARLETYRGNYDGAITYANDLIGNTNYPLSPAASTVSTVVPKNQYALIWTDSPAIIQNEVIFKLERLANDASIGKIWAQNNHTPSGQPIYLMELGLYNNLNNTNDARRASFISTGSTSTTRCIGKYPTPSGTGWVNDVKIFRTSEMYFIKAEYYASIGDFTNVQLTLQEINKARFRTVASTPTIPTPTSDQEAWAEILKQRRLELCYEGHRYLDLKRLGAKAGVNVTRDENDPNGCSKYSACGVPDAYKYTFPIPNIELKANPIISQNDGY